MLIRRSETDQTGEGQEVAIPRGYKPRPVEAVQTWLAAAEISSGRLLWAGRCPTSPWRATAPRGS